MNQKIIVITGANRGIGFAACKSLKNEGHFVIATARSAAGLDELSNEFSSYDDHALYTLDVDDESSIIKFGQDVQERFEHIDCIINNAGIFPHSTAINTSSEEIIQTLKTNLIGPLLVTQQMIPLMQKSSSAKIINVSSQMGSIENSGPGYAAYRISKTALNSLSRNLHYDYSDQGIKVYAVCPGWVHTTMGGPNAPRTPEQGASSILYPFYNDVESGSFLQDGKDLKW